MAWFYLALASAVFGSLAAIIQKRTLFIQHAMEFSATLAIVNAIFTLPGLFYADISRITAAVAVFVALNGALAAIAYLLMSKALRHMDISEASPLLALGPGITAVVAFIFLGEQMTRLQVAGIMLMMFGVYVLQTHRARDLFEPIRAIWNSRSVHYVLLAVLIYAFTAMFDRFILVHYALDPWTYLALIQIAIAIAFLVMQSYFYKGIRDLGEGFRTGGWAIVLIAGITVLHRATGAMATKIAPVAIVTAVVRTSAFFTTLIGGELFHEKNLARKILACVIMVAGVLMLL